jgi:hypothetical protein
MNVFNRVILVLVLLGLIILVTAVLIFPNPILTNAGQFFLDWGEYFAWVDQQQLYLRLSLSVGIALIVDLILVLLIVLEIKPKRKRFVKIEQVSGGKATVSIDSIVRQLLYKLDPLPGVIKVNPVVNPKGNKIAAHLDVTVTRERAIPEIADQLISTAKLAISEDLGLMIAGEPQVRIKVVEGVQQPSTSSAEDQSKSNRHSMDLPVPEKMKPADENEEWA